MNATLNIKLRKYSILIMNAFICYDTFFIASRFCYYFYTFSQILLASLSKIVPC